MTRDRAVAVARKLLALAKTKGPEAANAKRQMVAIMKRHNIKVEEVADHRVRIAGVAGCYWREVILGTAAKAAGVIVDETARSMSVVGEEAAVRRAAGVYHLGNMKVVTAAQALWLEAAVLSPEEWGSSRLGGRYRRYNERFTREEAAIVRPALLRLLGSVAAETFTVELNKPPRPATAAPQSGPQSVDDDDESWTEINIPLPATDPAAALPPSSSKKEIPLAQEREQEIIDEDLRKITAIADVELAVIWGERALALGTAIGYDLVSAARATRWRLAQYSIAFPEHPTVIRPGCSCATGPSSAADYETGHWILSGSCGRCGRVFTPATPGYIQGERPRYFHY